MQYGSKYQIKIRYMCVCVHTHTHTHIYIWGYCTSADGWESFSAGGDVAEYMPYIGRRV